MLKNFFDSSSTRIVVFILFPFMFALSIFLFIMSIGCSISYSFDFIYFLFDLSPEDIGIYKILFCAIKIIFSIAVLCFVCIYFIPVLLRIYNYCVSPKTENDTQTLNIMKSNHLSFYGDENEKVTIGSIFRIYGTDMLFDNCNIFDEDTYSIVNAGIVSSIIASSVINMNLNRNS